MKKLEYKFVFMKHNGDGALAGWGRRAEEKCNEHATNGYVIVNHIPAINTVVIVMAREKEEA